MHEVSLSIIQAMLTLSRLFLNSHCGVGFMFSPHGMVEPLWFRWPHKDLGRRGFADRCEECV